MGMGKGISGMAEGKAADWEDTVGDFCAGSDNSGSWAFRGFSRGSSRVLIQKKRPIAPFLAVGSKVSLVGCVWSSRRRVERGRGRKTRLTLDEGVQRSWGGY